MKQKSPLLVSCIELIGLRAHLVQFQTTEIQIQMYSISFL